MNSNRSRNKRVRGGKGRGGRRQTTSAANSHRMDNVSILVVPFGIPKKRRTRDGRELKVFDTALFTTTPSSSGSIQDLTTIAQGVTLTERVGDIAHLKQFWLSYTCNAANADVFSTVRIIIFQWHVNLAFRAPLVTDILQLATDNVNAFLDINYSDQATILYDATHSFSGTATTPTASSNQNFQGELSLSKCNKKMVFQVSAAAASNFIFSLQISDSAVIPFPVVNMKARCAFTD